MTLASAARIAGNSAAPALTNTGTTPNGSQESATSNRFIASILRSLPPSAAGSPEGHELKGRRLETRPQIFIDLGHGIQPNRAVNHGVS